MSVALSITDVTSSEAMDDWPSELEVSEHDSLLAPEPREGDGFSQFARRMRNGTDERLKNTSFILCKFAELLLQRKVSR
jgi:broad specificity phosphatase PhoE